MSRDRNLQSAVDDDAPPPYTPTDIYSNSASNHSANGDTSQASTSGGDIILTPPASPPAGYYRLPPERTGTSPPPILVVHGIAVGFDTVPEDLPCSRAVADQGVEEQDWATFLNYLLPDHAARRNEALLDRKLRDEDASNSGKSTGSGGKSRAEEQLSGMVGGEERMDEATWRGHAVRTVKEWNETFFGPKGVAIDMQFTTPPQQDEDAAERTMPGAWISPEVEERAGGSQDQQDRSQQERSGWRRHFDRVKMTDNTLRIGENFVADVNGLKIGGLVLDGHGIRMDGGQPQPPPRHGGPVTGGFPRGMPGRWTPGWTPGCQHPGVGDARGRSFGPPGGYPTGPDTQEKQRRRSHSVSSVSSVSSIGSACSSISSLESLPDYDDLNDNQLPLYASRLDAWVHSPETIRTRQDVSNLKAELKLARAASLDPAVDKKALRKHVKQLRQEWKGVRRDQKRVLRERKREKKTRRRGEKRERKERKREVKRSAREAKREMKGAWREQKDAWREERGKGRGRGQWPMHCSGQMPEGMAMFGRGGGGGRGGPAPFGGLFGARGLFGPQGSFDARNYSAQVPYPPQPPVHPFSPATFGPIGGSFPHDPFSNGNGTRSAPPGAWPEDKSQSWQYPEEKKAEPAAERSGDGGQEAGVVEAPVLEDRVKELEEELERKMVALDGMKEGEKARKEAEKEVEALMERLDGLRVEMDERYARELASRG
ncbi:hypothetical protein LIA77_08163 [Sarocladium implicatum]|nr:hypothetical protein LIA77_08163 [Sarocladium implicatum]